MKIKDIYFLKSCTSDRQFPSYDYPEFAFIGRSNVGKSSLINMLMGRKDLVKTGSKPGVTRTINFFVLNETISIVDLPGYGYAKVPKNVRQGFLPMVQHYIKKRKSLKVAFVLMDIRRLPDQHEENIIKALTGLHIPVVITLTKIDKLSNNMQKKHTSKIAEKLGVSEDSFFLTSAKTGRGKNEILGIISEYSSKS